MRTDPLPGLGPADPNIDERCLLYLLGELSDEQRIELEADLARSPELRSQLMAQSDLVLGLSGLQPPVTPGLSGYDPVRWALTVASIAACTLIAFFSWPTKQADQQVLVDRSSSSATPESLLIAQAWAEGSLVLPLSEFSGDVEPLTASDKATAFADSEQTWEDDSSLSWIVSAVEAGAISDG
jgi:anti-sigma factor RsiW